VVGMLSAMQRLGTVASDLETYHLSGRAARRQHDGELGWAAVAAAD
jgi:hypothetical protein